MVKIKKRLEDYSAGTIKNRIQMIEKAAGIEHTENRATHGFRHTLTTYFGISGVGLSLDIIDKFIGHKESENSTSKKFYVMKQPTAIDFKNFIAAQLAYAECLNNNGYEDELPNLFKVYSEIIENKLLIERGELDYREVYGKYRKKLRDNFEERYFTGMERKLLTTEEKVKVSWWRIKEDLSNEEKKS